MARGEVRQGRGSAGERGAGEPGQTAAGSSRGGRRRPLAGDGRSRWWCRDGRGGDQSGAAVGREEEREGEGDGEGAVMEVRCGTGWGRRKHGRDEEKKERKRRKEKGQGPEKKRKGLGCKLEGLIHEKTETEEGGCKMPGGGKRSFPGETLGFEVRWALGRGWATLSQYSKYFILQIKFGNLIFENGDDCLDKIFFRQF